MNEVTRVLAEMERGAPGAAEQLLPLVYEELRKLARQRLAREPASQTLEATALVHEAYLRLVDGEEAQNWNSRGHFFAAAAESMRRILVDNARRKQRPKHGGDRARQELDAEEPAAPTPREDLLALDQALNRLAIEEPQVAKLVELRHFAGLSVAEAARVIGVSPRSADRMWAFARAWLHQALSDTSADPEL